MSEWRWHTLEDLGDGPRSFAMGPFGSKLKTENFQDRGVPVIRGKNLLSNYFVDNGFAFISEEKSAELASAEVLRGDLVFTHRGTIGQVALIPQYSKFPRYIASQSQMRARFDRSKADNRFIFYWFRSPTGQHKLLRNATQTGVPAIARPLTHLRSLRIFLPPLPEQRRIAGVLGALDDLIDTNERLIQKLDALFLAIWYDVSRVTQQNVQISELVTTQYGVTASASPVAGLPRLLRVTDINKRNWIRWAEVPGVDIDEDTYEKYQLYEGDIVVARMADPGKSAYVDGDVSAVFASYLVRLIPQDKIMGLFLYGFLKSEYFSEYVLAASTGSVQKHMNAKVIAAARLGLPFQDDIEKFYRLAKPLRLQLASLVSEIRQLSETRDELLPLLMSGKIRVREAEEVVQEVAG